MSSNMSVIRPSIIRPIPIWALRVAWATLPLTAGPAAGAALRDWSDAPRIAAEVLLWLTWGTGLLATIAPRPQALAALRTIAPAYLVLAIVVAADGSASTVASAAAVVATAIAAALASGHDIALASANSASYGDEIRVPLRTPPALFLGPIPLARLLVIAAVATPVLLLAAEEWVWGAVALVVSGALLAVLPSALLRLTRRWAVLVPAGFVIVDPMTLADPVLFLREHIVALGAAPAEAAPAAASATDLRLGASRGSVVLRLDGPVDITLAARGRRPAHTVHTEDLRIAAIRRDPLLALAGARRLPIRSSSG
jgi:hypothetical protein